MPTMKVTLVKPSRHYSPDVVSAYQDEDDGDWADCYLAVVTGTFLGGAIGALGGPAGALAGSIFGGVAAYYTMC